MEPNHFEPQIVAFCCKYCAYAAADLAGSMRLDYPPNLKIVQLPCSGRVDMLHLLKAIEEGADGVCVAGCLEGECHFVEGNLKTRKKVEAVKKADASVKVLICGAPVTQAYADEVGADGYAPDAASAVVDRSIAKTTAKHLIILILIDSVLSRSFQIGCQHTPERNTQA